METKSKLESLRVYLCVFMCVCVRVTVVFTVVVVSAAEAGTSPAKQLIVLGTWQGFPGSCLVRNLATNFVAPFKLMPESEQSPL